MTEEVNSTLRTCLAKQDQGDSYKVNFFIETTLHIQSIVLGLS